jgi:hypothetical protein
VEKTTNMVILNVGNYQTTKSHISEDVSSASSLSEQQILQNDIFNLVYLREKHRVGLISEKKWLKNRENCKIEELL